MPDTFSQFLLAYSKASPYTKQLIDGEEIGLFVDTILTPTTTTLKPKLLVLLSNTVLGVAEKSKLIEAVQSLGITDYNSIEKIKSFVDTKLTEAQAAPTAPQDITAEIAAAEAALETLAPFHTMATDGKQIGYAGNTVPTPPHAPETTYTSMQSAILHEGEAK